MFVFEWYFTDCSVDCKNNNTISEIGKQPKQTMFYNKVISFILNFKSTLSFPPQLSQLNRVYAWSEVCMRWHILTAQSFFININLCVGKDVGMFFCRLAKLCESCLWSSGHLYFGCVTKQIQTCNKVHVPTVVPVKKQTNPKTQVLLLPSVFLLLSGILSVRSWLITKYLFE